MTGDIGSRWHISDLTPKQLKGFRWQKSWSFWFWFSFPELRTEVVIFYDLIQGDGTKLKK